MKYYVTIKKNKLDMYVISQVNPPRRVASWGKRQLHTVVLQYFTIFVKHTHTYICPYSSSQEVPNDFYVCIYIYMTV